MGFQFVCAEGYLIFLKEGKFFVGLSFVWDACVVKAFLEDWPLWLVKDQDSLF